VTAHLPETEYTARRDRLAERMEEQGIDALFVPPSSDLEYLTGLERDVPSFGQSSYAHGWVTGAFIVPGREPLYVLPRMFVLFHLWGNEPDDLITVNETDDGRALFRKATSALGDVKTIGIGARTWGEAVLELQSALGDARLVNGTPLVNELRRIKSPLELELMTVAAHMCDEAMTASADKVVPGVAMADLVEEVEHQMRIRGSRTPSFPTHIFSYGYESSHDSTMASGLEPIVEGEAHREYAHVYDVMLAAQEAGRAAAVPGALAREVNAACRGPIEEAGLGEFFRHRMGHGIGLDVHEQPFISEEDETPLEAGMTFTDEPSIMWDGHFAVRIEDVVVCAAGGGVVLNDLSGAMVVR